MRWGPAGEPRALDPGTVRGRGRTTAATPGRPRRAPRKDPGAHPCSPSSNSHPTAVVGPPRHQNHVRVLGNGEERGSPCRVRAPGAGTAQENPAGGSGGGPPAGAQECHGRCKYPFGLKIPGRDGSDACVYQNCDHRWDRDPAGSPHRRRDIGQAVRVRRSSNEVKYPAGATSRLLGGRELVEITKSSTRHRNQ